MTQMVHSGQIGFVRLRIVEVQSVFLINRRASDLFDYEI